VGSEPAVLLAVADGIGAEGEQAAELALQVVGHYAHYVIPLAAPTVPALRPAVSRMLHAAGRRIWLLNRDHGPGGDAGSTLLCALVWGKHYLVSNAGDSRCYYVDGRGAAALTRDQPETGAGGRRLANALGWSTDLQVDLAPAEDELGLLDEHCAVLVCSDGLHAAVAEADIHAALCETRRLEDACRRLVALALDRGSSDSVSVAAVEVGHLRRPARRSRSRR
jgi:protein phosphatase